MFSQHIQITPGSIKINGTPIRAVTDFCLRSGDSSRYSELSINIDGAASVEGYLCPSSPKEIHYKRCGKKLGEFMAPYDVRCPKCFKRASAD